MKRSDQLKRREFLQLGAGAAAGLASVALGGCASTARGNAEAAPARRPNILLILADDMGYSDIGCYGGEVETPNIDGLAAGGLRFSRFYNCARCCPTRASLLTGLYPHQAGVGSMTWGLGPEHPGYLGELNDRCVTIPEVLRTAGYRTACVGKWHVSRPGSDKALPQNRGFEKTYIGAGYFFPTVIVDGTPTPTTDPDAYLTDMLGDQTIRYMDEFRMAGDAPYFIHVAFGAPHWPLQAKPEDIAKYRDVYAKGWDRIREERYARMVANGLVEPRWPLSPRDESVPAWEDAPNKEWEVERMAVYAAQIDCMDRNIGRILQKVKDMGEEDNTLVLFLSDNGGCAELISPMFGQFKAFPKTTPDGNPIKHGNDPNVMPGPANTFQSYGVAWANASNTPYRYYKHWIHEGGVSTPLIAYWPAGVKAKGRLTHARGHVMDIMATCLDVAGVAYPRTYEGRAIQPTEGLSLLPVLEGEEVAGHQQLGWEHEGHKALVDGNMKLVSRYPEKWELYDIAADRTEIHDLAAQHPDRVAALKAQFQTWADRVGVEPWDEMAPLADKSFREFMGLPADFKPPA